VTLSARSRHERTRDQAPQSGAGNQSVQLGIGTLAIIAIIVTMCSGRGEVERVQKDTAELKRQLGAIDRKLDTLMSQGSATNTSDVESASAPPEPVEVPSPSH